MTPTCVGERERLVDQPLQQVEHVERLDAVARRHRLRGFEVEAAREDGQASQHRPFLVVEQVVGPVDRGPQRLVALDGGAAPAGEEPEPLTEPLCDLGRGQRACPSPRPARSRAGCRRAAGRSRRPRATLPASTVETGPDCCGALREQTDGLALERDRDARADLRQRQAADDDEPFAGDAESLAARREHRDARACARRSLGRGRRRHR